MKKTLLLCIIGLFAFATQGISQVDYFQTNKKGSKYRFTTEKNIACTDVKNQGNTGTCWSFSMQSFLESEIIRMGNKPVDLAEMWTARNAYFDKAVKYVRMQGKTNFGQGGEPHDVISMGKKYGVVPQSVYSGLSADQKKYDHTEMENALKGFCDAIVKSSVEQHKTLSKNWTVALDGILDAYFGPKIKEFEVAGKKYTPQTYAQSLSLNFDDYVEITSFTHHPYYSQFVIEIPDNWADYPVYNVQLADLEAITDNAVANNYSIEWASDVSEKYFSHKNGLAILPEKKLEDMSATEKDSLFLVPMKQGNVTPEMRQEAFDDQSTQDDHGMHLVGSAKDQNGVKYYLIKNSWGAENSDMAGYFYCSKPYFLYKTTGIMVNKKAIPAAIAKKMGII
jgi:bleomycin hydrolase